MRLAEESLESKSVELAMPSINVDRIRSDFPILSREVHGHPLVYLDNAASAQKPQSVIDAVAHFDASTYANVHRGVHFLSEEATKLFEAGRERVRRFLNAAEDREIIFVKGTSEAINLVAQTCGRDVLNRGDEVLVTEMEHHSNIVPWQMICKERGASLRVIPINDQGEVELDAFEELLGPRTKILSMVHVSNALGTVNPIKEMIARAREHGVLTVIDGAQAVPHQRVDVQDLGCDFYAFSGHKLFGPTGIGALYGRAKVLEKMPPYQGGGEMIAVVTFEKTLYKEIPHKFEAGTPNISGVIGLSAAINYVEGVGFDAISQYEQSLLAYATERVVQMPQLRIIGMARHKASVVSFVVEGVHAHDVGTILDRRGIAVRVGHHCAQPVMQRFGVPATARASMAFYNTSEEIDILLEGAWGSG